MQRLKVSHLTEYTFANYVTLEPHRLLLRPREGHDIRILSSRLDITPACKIRWHRDVYDNNVATVNFQEAASVTSSSKAAISRSSQQAQYLLRPSGKCTLAVRKCVSQVKLHRKSR